MRDSYIKKQLVKLYEYVYAKTLVPRIRKKYSLRIMSMNKTVDRILKTRCSVSRYGEGEFNIMFWSSKIQFQGQDQRLAERMRDILCEKNPNLLICVPGTIVRDRGYTSAAKEWWRTWSKHRQKDVVTEIEKRTGKWYVYGDALFTRPYMDIKSKKRAGKSFDAIKRLWDDRELLIVEGAQTRLGVGNDLFSNAASVKRILAPAENAFSRYGEIVSAVEQNYSGELVLLALGPTATVLSADLSKKGYQAIDIGHIDIEYEWYLAGASDKMAIDGKYTNEVDDGRAPTECINKEYLAQIVERIG